MNKKLLLSLALMTLFLSGCARNVLFSETIETSRLYPLGASEKDVFRIYLDMRGDLYPDTDFIISTERLESAKGSLFYALRDERSRCPEATNPYHDYCAAAKKEELEASYLAWERQQQTLWRETATELRRALQTESGWRPLVVLIHGFNVVNAYPDYVLARTLIGRNMPSTEAPVFLEVHWDGYLSVRKRAWSNAQGSAPLVGLKLRSLFEYLDEEQPVRVLTHSSGGVVAASLVGNASIALPNTEQLVCPDDEKERAGKEACNPYVGYRCYASEIGHASFPLPRQRDFRVGMLVAATPSSSFTQKDVKDRVMRKYCPDYNCGVGMENVTLVFGMNPRDSTITKGFGLERISVLGATTMGTGGRSFGNYCHLESSFRGSGVAIHGFNFEHSRSLNAPGYLNIGESHAFSDYLQREKIAPFLRLLLNPALSEGNTTLGLSKACQ